MINNNLKKAIVPQELIEKTVRLMEQADEQVPN